MIECKYNLFLKDSLIIVYIYSCILTLYLVGFGMHHLVECIDLVPMMMTVAMETGMKIEMDMVMAKKKNTTTGMMIGMVNMGTRMVVMEIITVKNGMRGMDIGMMTIREEAKALMVTVQEAGALIEIENMLLMMMAIPHLGTVLTFL